MVVTNGSVGRYTGEGITALRHYLPKHFKIRVPMLNSVNKLKKTRRERFKICIRDIYMYIPQMIRLVTRSVRKRGRQEGRVSGSREVSQYINICHSININIY